MLVQRGRHMQRHSIKPQDMPTRAQADERFGKAQSPNNALMNLCELPILFYVLCILVLILNRPDVLFLTCAWIYVGLRAIQAFIHVTYNDVLQRGIAYLASSALLWFMWARLAGQIYLDA